MLPLLAQLPEGQQDQRFPTKYWRSCDMGPCLGSLPGASTRSVIRNKFCILFWFPLGRTRCELKSWTIDVRALSRLKVTVPRREALYIEQLGSLAGNDTLVHPEYLATGLGSSGRSGTFSISAHWPHPELSNLLMTLRSQVGSADLERTLDN
jgi:hypothetical protein